MSDPVVGRIEFGPKAVGRPRVTVRPDGSASIDANEIDLSALRKRSAPRTFLCYGILTSGGAVVRSSKSREVPRMFGLRPDAQKACGPGETVVTLRVSWEVAK